MRRLLLATPAALLLAPPAARRDARGVRFARSRVAEPQQRGAAAPDLSNPLNAQAAAVAEVVQRVRPDALTRQRFLRGRGRARRRLPDQLPLCAAQTARRRQYPTASCRLLRPGSSSVLNRCSGQKTRALRGLPWPVRDVETRRIRSTRSGPHVQHSRGGRAGAAPDARARPRPRDWSSPDGPPASACRRRAAWDPDHDPRERPCTSSSATRGRSVSGAHRRGRAPGGNGRGARGCRDFAVYRPTT